jgi:hypothetical protein
MLFESLVIAAAIFAAVAAVWVLGLWWVLRRDAAGVQPHEYVTIQ